MIVLLDAIWANPSDTLRLDTKSEVRSRNQRLLSVFWSLHNLLPCSGFKAADMPL